MPTLRAVLAGVVGVLLLVGVAQLTIGSSIAGTPVAAPPFPGPAAATSTLEPGRPQPPAPTVSPEARLDQLKAALLRPAEVGKGWRASPQQPTPNASAPAVCGGTGVVARFPDAHRIGTALQGESGDRLQQTLSVFSDAATAGSAFDAFADGLDCAKGTLGGTAVSISDPEDVRSQVKGERATSWTLSGEGFRAVLISVVAKDQLMNFVFLTPNGGDLTKLDALVLAKTGVARLLNT
ncbi:hypothetical protein ACQEVB_13120 [Pseudonocardia sp. CA-107938]|uniref:hypothetical protein n=1 Tax=Pseudonocardia sp. CA-107938 TaxID=3240021 RepID=UPI003D9444D4